MLLITEEDARHALKEVVVLQRAVEGGFMPADRAGDEIVERLEAVVRLYEARGSTNVYEYLVEPVMRWAIRSIAPQFITDPTSPDAVAKRHLYDAISAFFKRHGDLVAH